MAELPKSSGARPAPPPSAANHYIEHHKKVAKATLLSLLKTPIASLFTCAVLGIALVLPALLTSLLSNIESLGDWDGSAQITLLLKKGVPLIDGQRLADDIAKRKSITSSQFIDNDSALSNFKERFEFADAIDYLDSNPLPHVIIVRPSDALNKKSSKASLPTDEFLDGKSTTTPIAINNKSPTRNDDPESIGKEKKSSNKLSKAANAALEQMSIPAKLARVLKTQSKKECSLENDEYLKNLESDNDSSHSSIAEELCRKPPERVGIGVPLFNEPEDEFPSDEEDEYESDVSEEGIRQTANELDFEQIWRMKLSQTSEMLRNGGRFGSS